MKKCSNCKQVKSYSEFNKASNTITGYSAYCKICMSNYSKQRYVRKYPKTEFCRICGIEPKDRKRAVCKSCVYKDRISTQYGLTLEQYNLMLERQGNMCAICSAPDPLCIDHDHSCCPGIKTCGKCIRGLLCRNCNTALGLLKDDSARLLKAVEYLQTVKVQPHL